MPSGVQTLFPYMNARNYPIADDNVLLVAYNGTITFKWGVETAGTSLPTFFIISAQGTWGGYPSVSHFPICAIRDTVPGGFTTYASEAAMQADKSAPAITSHSDDSGAEYAKVGSEYWVLVQYASGKVWVPIRTKTSAGTATINGVACDLYTAQLDVSDVPQYLDETMEADELFDLCWGMNGRHAAYGWDAMFKLTPEGVKLHDGIFKRTELNTRIAGEKGLYEDEAVVVGQIEAGTGVTIRKRTVAGVLTGYTPDAARGGNIVIEASPGVEVQGAGRNGSIYYIAQPSTVRYQSGRTLHVEPDDSRIPVDFSVVLAGDGATVIQGAAHGNNLYVSRRNTLGVNTYPMDDPAFGDQTVNHIRFKDSTDLTWTVVGTRMPTQTPDGIIYRKGITVEAAITFPPPPPAYSWSLRDQDSDTVTVADTETVVLYGANGVTTNIISTSDPYSMVINRPLGIYDDGVQVGGDNIVKVDFDKGTYDTTSGTPTPVNFVVTNPNSGEVRVQGLVKIPAVTAEQRYSTVSTDSFFPMYNPNAAPDFVLDRNNPQVFYGFTVAYGRVARNFVTLDHQEDLSNDKAASLTTADGGQLYIRRTGAYQVAVTLQGHSSVDLSTCSGMVPNHHAELALTLFVRRAGQIYAKYSLDHRVWTFPGYVPAPGRQLESNYPPQEHARWCLSGLAQVELEEDDYIFYVIDGICYIPGYNANRIFIGPSRNFTIDYCHHHIHDVATSMADNTIKRQPVVPAGVSERTFW